MQINETTEEFETIRRQLMSSQTPQKPKMLVVDDEPDNLDLLYRTFRRTFQVLKAESGIQALEILSEEGEVAVIISDQRMPEMKGTEFLSKTVPEFPDTVRIILTGFTDIEDLVEAINSGQVYKYITKPWDPNELKTVVQRAAETYDVLKHRTEELHRAEAQNTLLSTILTVAQESSSLEECLEPIATVFGKTFSADVCLVQLVAADTLADAAGGYAVDETLGKNWLDSDPLVAEALKTRKIQASFNIAKDEALANIEHYQAAGIQAHLAIPAIYRGEAIALLSLQWQTPCTLREDELALIHLSAQHLAIALASTRYYQSNGKLS